MDVTTTRHRNLQQLAAQLAEGGRAQKEVAVDLDMSASFLSQLLGGKKMGDDVARKIEVAAQLPHGWMDVAHRPRAEEPSADYRQSHPARLEAPTLAAALELVRKACENLGIHFDPEEPSDAAIVLIACTHLETRGETQVTVDNLVDFTKRLRLKAQGEMNEEGSGARRTGTGTGGEGTERAAG